MISPLRVGQHLELVKLIQMPEVVKIETRHCLPVLIDMKVHYHLCKTMLRQSYKKWDIGQLLISHPLVYGVWHPYNYAVTTVYRLYQPLFKLVEQVHTGFKFGDNVVLEPALLHMEKSVLGLVLAAKDVRGRLNRWSQRLEGTSRSQSALHMHVLVCICSNVRRFHKIIGMIHMCYHTINCTWWPCFVDTKVFVCYKTEKGILMLPSFTRVTLRLLALLAQGTWTGTVCFRGRKWSQGTTSGTKAACSPLNIWRGRGSRQACPSIVARTEDPHLLICPDPVENWYTCAGLQLGWPQGPF